MDLKQLEYIVAIAEEGNLSRAAEKLYITQSALSQQLKKLKDEGLPPLFTERKHRMELTDAGKIYLNGARAILRLEDLALKELQELSSGTVQVFHLAVASYLQPDCYFYLVPTIRKLFPQLSLHVAVYNYQSLLKLFENGDIDLAFIPEVSPFAGQYHTEHLFQDELVIITKDPVDPLSLPMVLPSAGSPLRELMNHRFSAINHYPEIYAETLDTGLAFSLVKTGLCSSIVPRSLIPGPDYVITPFLEPCHFDIIVVCRKGQRSPVMEAVLQELKRLF